MNLKSALKLTCLSLSMAAAFSCSGKDKGVGSTLREGEEPSESREDGKNEDGENGQDGEPGQGTDLDAGGPDNPMIIEVGQEDASCASTSAEAPKVVVEKEIVKEVSHEEIKPVAIFLMLDRSSSMVGTCNPLQVPLCSAESWPLATGAITTFLRDPASASLNVALGYFPPVMRPTDVTPTGPLCTGASCAAAAVPMALAPQNAGPIGDSLNHSVPPADLFNPNYTPMECALKGMSAFCKAHTERTKEKCVGVLVTDGVPDTQCDLNRDNLAMVTATAAMQGTPIFTLGLAGTDYNFLNRIAMSGGTDCTPMDPNSSACNVSSGQAAFIAALNGIRDRVQVKENVIEKVTETTEVPLDCEWKLPDPPADMKFDKDKVNVTFTATGKDASTLGRVNSEEECVKHPEGWRYDSESAPTKVLACSGACDLIKKSPGAKINIEFGCKGRSLE